MDSSRTARPTIPRSTALLVTALIVLATSGCGGASPPRSEHSLTETTSAASDTGGTEDEDATIPVLPPEQEVQVTDPCTGEGAYTLTQGAALDPALPERHGSTLTLALTGVGQDEHGANASLTAALDSDEPKPVAPIHIGERFQVDIWTFAITSVCPGQVELDLID